MPGGATRWARRLLHLPCPILNWASMDLLQVEQEGITVKESSHFNPDPDAEILYKAMKGIGE